MVQPFCKMVSWFLIKPNILLPYDPTILIFGIYPNKLKTRVYTKTSMWMFIIEVLIISDTLKQWRSPSVIHLDNEILFRAKKKKTCVLLTCSMGRDIRVNPALLVATIISLWCLPNIFLHYIRDCVIFKSINIYQVLFLVQTVEEKS